MADSDLSVLIIQNLADIEQTEKALYRLEVEVFKAIDNHVEVWAEQNGWDGKFDYFENEFWLAPRDWKSKEDDEEYVACFWMDVYAGDTQQDEMNEDWHFLTRLLGVGDGQLGLKFSQEIVTNSKFKKRAHVIAPLIQSTAFSRDPEGAFFLPIKLDAKELAEAVKNEKIEDAFGPLNRALESLKAAKSAFDDAIKQLEEGEA